jgi:hypothetical protein
MPFPFGEMQRLNATELAEKGPNGEPSEATDAFNFLQDNLVNPTLRKSRMIPIPTAFAGADR